MAFTGHWWGGKRRLGRCRLLDVDAMRQRVKDHVLDTRLISFFVFVAPRLRRKPLLACLELVLMVVEFLDWDRWLIRRRGEWRRLAPGCRRYK